MAELKPGEFLITRETDPDAFTRELDGSTDCRGEPLDLGPATRADLAELDAVPEPVDSDAPREVHQTTACLGPACARGPSDCWSAGRCLVEEP